MPLPAQDYHDKEEGRDCRHGGLPFLFPGGGSEFVGLDERLKSRRRVVCGFQSERSHPVDFILLRIYGKGEICEESTEKSVLVSSWDWRESTYHGTSDESSERNDGPPTKFVNPASIKLTLLYLVDMLHLTIDV